MKADSVKVDHDSFEPSYLQLVHIVQQQLASGALRPGDKLPSESQLCNYHSVSPMTVRRAINILVQEGSVSAEQGRGTFVRSINFWDASFHLQFLQELFSEKSDSKVKIIEASIIVADERVQAHMSVKTRDKVIYIRRLILLRGKPYLYHREYLVYDPLRPIIESEMEVTSLGKIFKGLGNTTLKRSELSIEATLINPLEAQLLEAPLASAAFLLEHTFFDFDDKPVSWGWFLCPGNRLRFKTVVGGVRQEQLRNG